MPSRAQLALALILLLVLAPLASATCGIACLAATPHRPMQAATAPHHCVRASVCCHSSGPAICAATQAPEIIAAILSTRPPALHDASALAAIAAESLPQNGRNFAAYTDSSPPGQLHLANPIPLRV
jgi:hypothetical protein